VKAEAPKVEATAENGTEAAAADETETEEKADG
jgi:hypothetical protein